MISWRAARRKAESDPRPRVEHKTLSYDVWAQISRFYPVHLYFGTGGGRLGVAPPDIKKGIPFES
jgi:hypothetical protein